MEFVPLTQNELRRYGPLELAYVGDGVYELMVRNALVRRGAATAAGLHRRTVALVKASAQAVAAERVLPFLTEEEHDVFQRGRNAKPKAIPRRAEGADYMMATALECLFGWLHLRGETGRIRELFDLAVGAD